VCSSVWRTRPHSAALCVARPTSASSCTSSSPARLGWEGGRRNGEVVARFEAAAAEKIGASGLKTSRDPRWSPAPHEISYVLIVHHMKIHNMPSLFSLRYLYLLWYKHMSSKKVVLAQTRYNNLIMYMSGLWKTPCRRFPCEHCP
jgi:hypothetical protein